MTRRERLVRAGLALGGGAACGIFMHYLLYRISLPLTPFIYVAF